jgi:hypothetical protein
MASLERAAMEELGPDARHGGEDRRYATPLGPGGVGIAHGRSPRGKRAGLDHRPLGPRGSTVSGKHVHAFCAWRSFSFSCQVFRGSKVGVSILVVSFPFAIPADCLHLTSASVPPKASAGSHSGRLPGTSTHNTHAHSAEADVARPRKQSKARRTRAKIAALKTCPASLARPSTGRTDRAGTPETRFR